MAGSLWPLTLLLAAPLVGCVCRAIVASRPATRFLVFAKLASGVLTLKTPEGTWVLNKQVPNRQLWLSSPVSGPCRYEHVDGTWTHTRDGSSLAELLERELGLIM